MKPKIQNVDKFQITWDNDQFYFDITDIFGEGTRYIFPPEDIRNLWQAFGEALRQYEKGETSD